ncbi:uncharacterized protein LOC115245458 [Formica exsecta]|uniref:uncharacterized protein LOC115245458 n=1 Tax=Formica exsecta TaxID=72781 RepID=UPI001144EDAB|nr:uncharacterized protein LOC115245458 [Formica exsecta]
MSNNKILTWIKPYPELVLDKDKVFCRACGKIISRDRKYLIDQHAKTPSHIGKCEKFKKSTALHQTLGQCLKNNSKLAEQEVFNKDLCQALVASNIPLNKLNNINFQLFLKKYCKQHIPDESTLRKKFVNSCYAETISKIRQIIGNNYIYFIVDETTDSCGRYIAHLLIGSLCEDNVSKSYLISSKQLEKTNNLTITRFIQDGLSEFFLLEHVPSQKILLLLSDVAPYMIKAGQNLKIFYENLIHVSCLAHDLNRVAEEIRNQFPLINDLIKNVKKTFLKASLRVQLYKEQLPNTPLPPEPIITRWDTWLTAAIFYADNYNPIMNIILALTNSSFAIENCIELFKKSEIQQQLGFIKSNYSFVAKIIEKLEKEGMSLLESIELIEEFEILCKNVKVCYTVDNKEDNYGGEG